MSRRDGCPSTVAVVLAAGAGSRFCDVGHKLVSIVPERGMFARQSVISRSIAICAEGTEWPIVVVTGRLDDHELGLDDELRRHGERLVVRHNPDWATGQMSSLRVGLATADDLGADVAVIGLADQPGIESAAWTTVAAAADVESPICVATYDGRRANPVALFRSVWDLLPADGDEGARSLMRIHPELVREVPCSGSPDDIDTVEDLRRWQNS